ncbi:MAG: hypothetical protein CMN50_03565 [SAR116 cluster bacterium]|nr:hypothetical protein [SAR116 cluster bacterium]|tara:strand:- start:221 stop:646 length:426 start_codon:yes stop_codon:yes gene_type:complete
MFYDFILSKFEIIIFVSLILIVFFSGLIFYIQNKFISDTNQKLDNLANSILKNNREFAEYLKTLSDVIEGNRENTEKLSLKINTLEKEISRMINIKGNDDMLSYAIELTRSGETKESIKEKTGLNEDEIETIYAYHRNLKD